MNKENNVLEIVESFEVAQQPELIKLDDLSLALVGGGQGAVDI